jgi:hypothetical protein
LVSSFVLVLSVLLPAHTAHAASVFELCDENGQGLCVEVTRFSPVIDAIMEPDLSGGYQRMYNTAVNICNGSDVVTTTCPFAVGYGMNNDFVGDIIEEFHFNQNPNYCFVDSTSNQRADVLPCGSNGTNWVVDTDNRYCAGGDIVSVYQSNISKYPELLVGSSQGGSPLTEICQGGIGYNSWGDIFN